MALRWRPSHSEAGRQSRDIYAFRDLTTPHTIGSCAQGRQRFSRPWPAHYKRVTSPPSRPALVFPITHILSPIPSQPSLLRNTALAQLALPCTTSPSPPSSTLYEYQRSIHILLSPLISSFDHALDRPLSPRQPKARYSPAPSLEKDRTQTSLQRGQRHRD